MRVNLEKGRVMIYFSTSLFYLEGGVGGLGAAT